MKLVKNIEENKKKNNQISDREAEEAIKTIVKWIGKTQIEKV